MQPTKFVCDGTPEARPQIRRQRNIAANLRAGQLGMQGRLGAGMAFQCRPGVALGQHCRDCEIKIAVDRQWCNCARTMMKRHIIEIERIYVPVKRAKTLDAVKVDALAEDMLEHGQTTPISVRLDKKDGTERYVLVEGLHRLEAMKSLGDTTVTAFLVQARLR